MLKVYGSIQCPDCVQCKHDLDKAGVAYTFFEFSESLLHLKTFLQYRDSLPVFAQVKENGSIGIPCIVDEHGAVTLDWEQYL